MSLPATEWEYGTGELCLSDPASVTDIAPQTERWTAFGRATWQIAADHQLFAEYLYSRTRMTLKFTPTPASAFATIDSIPVLYPAGGPYYPTEYAALHGIDGPLDIAYRTLPLGPRTNLVTTEAHRLAIPPAGDAGARRAAVPVQHAVASRATLRAAMPGSASGCSTSSSRYLRAAMPKMRDTSSTVGQEIDLVRAYLAIVRLVSATPDLRNRVPAALADVRMPPMMLLPLIDHVIVHGLEPATGAGSIRIVARIGGGRLTLAIVDHGAGLVPDAEADGIAVIRQRLDALFRGDATLDLRRAGPRATEAVLELPLESRNSADDTYPSTG